jgi:FecR-like protein
MAQRGRGDKWAVWVYACLCLLMPCVATGQQAVGQITAASGAMCQRGVTQIPGSPGLLLYVGDVLTTVGTDSRVAVTMVDQTRLALGPKSRLVLRQFLWDARSQQGHAVAELPTGTLAVQSGGLGKRDTGNTLAVATPRTTVRVTDAEVGIRAGKE